VVVGVGMGVGVGVMVGVLVRVWVGVWMRVGGWVGMSIYVHCSGACTLCTAQHSADNVRMPPLASYLRHKFVACECVEHGQRAETLTLK